MIRVTHAVLFDEEKIQNFQDSWTCGPGLLAILDVKQKEGEFFIEPDSTVRIHRPDGTFIELIAKGVSISGGYVTLFFPKIEQHEIPVSSEIEVLP